MILLDHDITDYTIANDMTLSSKLSIPELFNNDLVLKEYKTRSLITLSGKLLCFWVFSF